MQATDLSSLLPEELEAEVKAAAEISMGTEVSDEDILNIQYLCDQVQCNCERFNAMEVLSFDFNDYSSKIVLGF